VKHLGQQHLLSKENATTARIICSVLSEKLRSVLSIEIAVTYCKFVIIVASDEGGGRRSSRVPALPWPGDGSSPGISTNTWRYQ
jgi:hypothetical protein